MKSETKSKKKGLFSKVAVMICFVSAFVFTATMIVTFFFKESVPDTLIVSFFSFISVEGGALALIKSYKTKYLYRKEDDTNGTE